MNFRDFFRILVSRRRSLRSEAQEEYDIWKAQFPKNLERTEIRHN